MAALGQTTTVYASIGNSDDKLTQARWAEFHAAFTKTVRDYSSTVHGSWLSSPADPWQNACVAFEVDGNDAGDLKRELQLLAHRFGQDSIAWAQPHHTEFIGMAPTDELDAGPAVHGHEAQPASSAKPAPTWQVSDIVHYVSHGTPGGEYPKACRAAIITQIDPRDDIFVGLCVLNPTGQLFNPRVMLHERYGYWTRDRKSYQAGTWHAAKTCAEPLAHGTNERELHHHGADDGTTEPTPPDAPAADAAPPHITINVIGSVEPDAGAVIRSLERYRAHPPRYPI